MQKKIREMFPDVLLISCFLQVTFKLNSLHLTCEFAHENEFPRPLVFGGRIKSSIVIFKSSFQLAGVASIPLPRSGGLNDINKITHNGYF